MTWTSVTTLPPDSPVDLEARMRNGHTIKRVTFCFNSQGGRWWITKTYVDVTRWVKEWRKIEATK